MAATVNASTSAGVVITPDNSGVLALQSSSTTALTIDASQNVGIGTASPTTKLTVNNASATDYVSFTTGGTVKGVLADQAGDFIIKSAAALLLQTNGSERGRIDSSGSLLVGTTSVSTITGEATAKAQVAGNFVVGNAVAATNLCMTINGVVNKAGRVAFAESGAIKWLIGNGAASENGVFEVYSNTTGTGVQLGRSATSWSAASDERIKDIIEPIADAANKVSSLRAVIGKYKTDESGTRRSFLIAQDVQAVLPEAVDDINPEKLGVRYTEVIPLLVAAIKEQQALITAQAATITALTARIVALENK